MASVNEECPPRIKVLCLHGNGQNRHTFERYMRPLVRKGKARNVEFILVDAPYPLSEPGLLAEKNLAVANAPRQWWPHFLSIEDIGQVEWTDAMAEQGKETIAYIDELIKETGASILLGFSQGANAVITYMEVTRDERIRRIVSCSGYAFAGTHTSKKIQTPLLHTLSGADTVVPAYLAPRHFEPTFEIKHDKGHRMVTRAQDCKQVIDFIADYEKLTSN